jgi:hypothetical protein
VKITDVSEKHAAFLFKLEVTKNGATSIAYDIEL